MEEKELENEQKENTTQEQPKKKGGKNSKKKDATEETMVTETPKDEAPVTTEAPKAEEPTEAPMVTETPKDEAPVTTEAPKDEAPVTTEAPKAEEPMVTEDSTESGKQSTGRKPVPSIPQLRKMRKFNEGVFTFADGFACVASSQRVADRMHSEWLEGK